MDTVRAMKGNKNVGMPAYAYQNVSTDQVSVLKNSRTILFYFSSFQLSPKWYPYVGIPSILNKE